MTRGTLIDLYRVLSNQKIAKIIGIKVMKAILTDKLLSSISIPIGLTKNHSKLVNNCRNLEKIKSKILTNIRDQL